MNDYYKTLEVSKNSSQEEIKASYKRLAKKHHPDIGGDEDIFKKISEAYEVLKDPKKRQIYDFQNRNTNYSQVDDIFANLFGFKRKQSENLNIAIEKIIPIEDFFKGTTIDILYKRKTIKNKKEIIEKISKKIKIPKGLQNKDLHLALQGHGHQSSQNENIFGNLIIILRVLDYPPYYIKHGDDVISEIPIPLHIALVGDEIEVPTLHGIKKVKITPEDCFHRRSPVAIEGCGLQKGVYSSEYGRHLLKISIETPAILSEEEKDFFKNMKIDSEKYPEYSNFLKLKKR